MKLHLLLSFLIVTFTSEALYAAKTTGPFGDADCQYYVDEADVPHLKAEDPLNLWACMGYVQAQFRGFQMEFLKRATEGKLSEVFGFGKLKADILLRLLKFSARAETLLKGIDSKHREFLEAFARGINQSLKALPETEASKFRHHGIEPSSWTAVNPIAILLLQSFFQTKRGFEIEVRAEKLRSKLKTDDVAPYMDDRLRPWATSIIKENELKMPSAAKKAEAPQSKSFADRRLPASALQNLLDSLDLPELRFHGSNNFVVGPTRTQSHHAYLANDTHLEIFDPPFFFWMALEGPGINVVGATVPGMPGVALGVNNHVAWGLTNSFYDSADLVLIKGDAPGIHSERPTIWIKWGPFKLPFKFKKIEWTEEGYPILPLDSPGAKSDEKLALEWTGFWIDPGSVSGLFDLPGAKSVQDFDKRIRSTRIPSWHFVSADTNGNIGYRMSGIGKRMKEMPRFGFSENIPLNREQDFLSPDEMPALINPNRGYIVTANNHPWPKNYSLKSGFAHESGLRAYRMEEMLSQKTPLRDSDIQNVQCDLQAVDARFLGKLLAAKLIGSKLVPPLINEEHRTLLTELVEQPLVFDLNCKLCGIYQLWVDHLRTKLEMEEIGLYQWISSADFGRDALLTLAETFTSTLEDLDWSPQSSKSWKEIHRNDFLNLGEDSRDPRFSLATPGAQHSVWLGQSDWDADKKYFRQSYAPVTRLIVEMSKPPRAGFVLAAGNTRDGSLPPKDDPMTQDWLSCRYRPLSLKFDQKTPFPMKSLRLDR